MRHRNDRAVLVALLVGTGLVSGCGGPVPAPKSLVKYTAKDGAFSCQYPKDWEVKDGSRKDNTFSYAKFTKGSAVIRFDADVAGSLMGDIAKNAGRDEHPTEALHEMYRRNVEEEYSGYKEAATSAIESGLGETQICEFSGGGLRGYRATALGHNRRVAIICACAPRDWNTLKSAFMDVIKSVGRGT
jgi:hypothetical protein